VAFVARDDLTGVVAVASAAIAAIAAWFVISRHGVLRLLALLVVVAALVAGVLYMISHDALLDVILLAAIIAGAGATGRLALGYDWHSLKAKPTEGVPVPAPSHPVIFMNPKSGGGKVEKFNLPDEAKKRGIEPVLLEKGNDLWQLARDAVARGADALGAAGGDGTQAIVADVARENDLPFACIPAGTRNHFALDLGVGRTDVVGALDAFVDGVERQVDLGFVNDRVFVNNVALGVYAQIVQSRSYRNSKIATAMSMTPDMFGPGAKHLDLRFQGPDGEGRETAHVILVSNNPYRLEGVGGVGSREHMDTGELGIVALSVNGAGDVLRLLGPSGGSAWEEWTAPEFQIDSGEKVEAGIDGEALVLDPPLRFTCRQGALRVRIARSAPGVSAAGANPKLSWRTIRGLVRTAFGRPA
jgi:diacylglycerol kinase family enzyme